MAGGAEFSRRGLLGAAGLAGIGAFVAACGGGSGGDDASGGGAWAFTDDRGKKAAAKARPRRVVAYIGSAAVLTDLGVGDRIAGVFGPSKQGGRVDPMSGNVDVDKIPSLGVTFGEFNVEKYAALHPELLVTHMFVKDVLWYVPDKSKVKIAQLAPEVGVNVFDVDLRHPIERYAELAASLGADLKSAANTAAKTRFDTSISTLRDAVKKNGKNIKVLAASAAADALYASAPPKYPDLAYFSRLGVDFVQPKPDSQGFFEELSWENAGKYDADLIMLDSRSQALQPKQLRSKPTWNSLPAVKAGQIVPWLSEPRYSYAGCAPTIEALAKSIASARKVT